MSVLVPVLVLGLGLGLHSFGLGAHRLSDHFLDTIERLLNSRLHTQQLGGEYTSTP